MGRERMKKATTQQPPATEQKAKNPLDGLADTDDGKQLIEMATAFSAKCAALNLPRTVQIAGVAPFSDAVIEQSKAQGFIEGREYQRLHGAYQHVLGAKQQ